MNDTFLSLAAEKRHRIINSALDEFSKYDYKKASTNNIVKDAGISKGLLFHYFTNKLELYDYLKDFTMSLVTKRVLSSIDFNETDIFERLMTVTIVKLDITKEYPKLYSFMLKVNEHLSIDELRELSNKYSPDIIQRVYQENIDYKLFKEDIDVKRAMTIIRWTLDKYSEEVTMKIKNGTIDYGAITEEMESYCGMLRKAFYK